MLVERLCEQRSEAAARDHDMTEQLNERWEQDAGQHGRAQYS